mmetsp:Transcript_1666/g.3314  ORF Transcript_1666/g.3314 Transcript_1666/m.3314 type:complete len:80 (-) Transcript_1666:49-288(-)
MEEYAVQRIALLKMDCEGCEYEVIPKAPFDKIDAVVGELHVTANATLKQQTEELLFKHRPKNASRTVFQHYGARMMPPR